MCKHAGGVHICSFGDALDRIPKSRRTYENVKAAVLKAGRFSVFEATEDLKTARIFDQLVRDPEIVTDHETVGFPWTLVRRAVAAKASSEQSGDDRRER